MFNFSNDFLSIGLMDYFSKFNGRLENANHNNQVIKSTKSCDERLIQPVASILGELDKS